MGCPDPGGDKSINPRDKSKDIIVDTNANSSCIFERKVVNKSESNVRIISKKQTKTTWVQFRRVYIERILMVSTVPARHE